MNDNLSHDESTAASKLIDVLLAYNRTISVHDGECWTVVNSTNRAFILDAMATTEMDTLKIREADETFIGTMLLVYGNAPDELVADHSDNPITEELWNKWQATL